MIGGELAQDPRSSVALCEGDTFYNCRILCGGTLVAPNLVVTSRHCADVVQIDSLDCNTYRFSGETKPASTLWVTVASPVSNSASFHQGLRWDFPKPIGCGHDLAFLTLHDVVPPDQATPQLPSTTHDLPGAAALDLYGYGRTGPDAPIDAERRHVQTHVLCVGGKDACATIPGGRDLLPTELAVDTEVCPGDSGSGVFDPGGLLLGTLARTIGGTNVCAYGVYTRLAPHGLLLSRAATTAAQLGAYAKPSWADALEKAGNSPDNVAKGFGAPCDGDEDCSSGMCRTFDEGLAWSCARRCSDGCSNACRGDVCFSEPSPAKDSGCNIATPAHDFLPVLLFLLVLRRRRR